MLECSLCRLPLDDPRALSCGHVFHSECIAGKGNCPVCRPPGADYELGINCVSCVCLGCFAYGCTCLAARALAAAVKVLPLVAVQGDWLARV